MALLDYGIMNLFIIAQGLKRHTQPLSIIIIKEPELNIAMSATPHSPGLRAWNKKCQHKTKSNESWEEV